MGWGSVFCTYLSGYAPAINNNNINDNIREDKEAEAAKKIDRANCECDGAAGISLAAVCSVASIDDWTGLGPYSAAISNRKRMCFSNSCEITHNWCAIIIVAFPLCVW